MKRIKTFLEGIMQKPNCVMKACVALALAGGSASVFASGFALMEQNASGLGNAFAGQAAAAENASTIYFNPAGMTLLPGMQASGTITTLKPSDKLTPSIPPSALPLGGTFNNGGDGGGSWKYIPTAYLSYQFGSSLWLGLGITAPFGLETNYDPTFGGRFQSQKIKLTTYDINPSVAWKVNDWLSVGGGLSYQHAKVELNSSVNIGIEALQTLQASDNQWGFNLGAMLNLSPNTRLGLTYRSVMSYDLRGNTVIRTLGGATVAAPQVNISVRMPDSYSAALSHKFNDQWQLLGDFTWTNWSSIKDVPVTNVATGGALQVLNLQFRDTYRLGVGANYKWNSNLMVKFGLAYDKSPVTDAVRTVALPDSDRTWLSIGGKYRLTQAGTFDFGYAHIFVKNGSINQFGGVGAPPATGNVVGTYKDKVDIISLSYSHAF
jgi:long-chain fatty acid transport protein